MRIKYGKYAAKYMQQKTERDRENDRRRRQVVVKNYNRNGLCDDR